MNNIIDLCGWIPHPDDVDSAAPTRFEDAAPYLMDTWDGKSNIRLWDHTIRVNGSHLPADKQTIGDCVSHGYGRGIDYLQCIQIALNERDDEYIEGENSCCTEALYGEAREVGGSLNNQDGAAGIWAINALLKWGFVSRSGKSYNGQLAKQYGLQGTPQEIKTQGRDRILTTYAQIKTIDELTNALWHQNPVPVCSNQGFSLTRDSHGVAQAQGSWGHCMLIIGMILINGLKHFTILQSWGPNMPAGPVIENMPDNSFNAEESVVTRMLKAGDTYGLAALPGFPSRPFNLFV